MFLQMSEWISNEMSAKATVKIQGRREEHVNESRILMMSRRGYESLASPPELSHFLCLEQASFYPCRRAIGKQNCCCL